MEYFKSGLKSVLGAPESSSQPSGVDTVERLVDRLRSSTLLDDRRDACRALKALSRTYRVEVGALGMDALRQVIEIERSDCEIVGLALDALCHITSSEVFESEVEKHGPKHEIGEQFTEIFIKQPDSVGSLLRSLEEFDFKVRWPALKLLSNLIANKPKEIQEIVLVSPMGISKLMDMLGDSREVIRNESLLLLIQLTKGNANIQKIVAFENAFDRIFEVIRQEGNMEGGIVVEDCLLLTLNLLRGNYSNQNFFQEGSYIQKLTPMFLLNPDNSDSSVDNWSPQKISNIHCLVQVVRALVAPSGHAQSISSCQKKMKACGLLQALCDILMISGVPADVLMETISALAEVVRGNTANQDFLANVMAPSSPPRLAIVVLLMSMVNEKQPFLLRCAVLYCFQSYLYKNEAGQMKLVQTLLPQSTEVPSLTTGQLLCGGLFSLDTLSNWFSAVALSYALIDSHSQKEQLLRVHLATNIGTPPVTLMHQCVMLFQQGNKPQSKLGLLMLLCRWTSFCPIAIRTFVSIDSSISFLIALLSSHESNDDIQEMLLQSMCAFLIGICIHFNDDSVPDFSKSKLVNLVENRIGLEKFTDALGGISRHEVYSRSLKHPQLYAKTPSDVLLDHEFCRLIKTLEGPILKTVTEGSGAYSSQEPNNSSSPSDSVLITQYKDLIRDQDIQIQKLKSTVEILHREKQALQYEVTELKNEVNSLTDQVRELRNTQATFAADRHFSSANHVSENQFESLENHQKQTSENELSSVANQIDHNLKNLCVSENSNNNIELELKNTTEELIKIKKDQENLLAFLADQDNKISFFKERLAAHGEKFDSDDSSGELDADDQPETST